LSNRFLRFLRLPPSLNY